MKKVFFALIFTVSLAKVGYAIDDGLMKHYVEECLSVIDKPVVDAHHIDFFTQSLNNNYNNVIILCPNHHRVVHTYQPLFKRQTKLFEYPNGYKEKVLLNFHL